MFRRIEPNKLQNLNRHEILSIHNQIQLNLSRDYKDIYGFLLELFSSSMNLNFTAKRVEPQQLGPSKSKQPLNTIEFLRLAF